MPMYKFRFLMWIGGFIQVAEGLANIVSLGFWLPAWGIYFQNWVFDLEIDNWL